MDEQQLFYPQIVLLSLILKGDGCVPDDRISRIQAQPVATFLLGSLLLWHGHRCVEVLNLHIRLQATEEQGVNRKGKRQLPCFQRQFAALRVIRLQGDIPGMQRQL